MKKIFGILLLWVAVTAQAQQERGGNSLFTPSMQKMNFAQMAIKALYVDTINEGHLVEEAIKKMLSTLDPHSTYSTPEEVKKLNEPLQGNFDGIGVQFQMMDDTLLVIQPITDGPSERVGILAGDRIITVNDSSIAGQKFSTDLIMSRLRGPKGTTVRLGVLRRGVDGLLPFTVTRDRIPVYSIDASYMAAPGVGYVRISRFAATTHEEFLKACAELRKEGMKDLIIDLQGNGGGYLQAAIDMANEFLDNKEVIVYTEGRAQPRQDAYADGEGTMRQGRVVVLVDDYSASASEILSGALQDWDRGVIVGRRTFGKGLVQRPITLPDESMIRLTTARYYTPAGRCIQKPYKAGDKASYEDEIEERFKHGEMSNADSISFADSLRCYTHKLHRTVYGGGGIMPDSFVPLDTTEVTPYYRKIAARGILIKLVSQYIDTRRKELKEQYPNFEAFRKGFEVPQSVWDDLKKQAEENKIEWNEEQYTLSLPLLSSQFKALLARDLWGMSEYFQIMNQRNEIYNKGLSILKDGTYKEILKKSN